MTAQDSKNKLYGTKDQEEIIMLLTHRNEIIKTEKSSSSGRTTFYFDRVSAVPLVRYWNTGKPMPVSDLRDVFRAYGLFYQVIHGEL